MKSPQKWPVVASMMFGRKAGWMMNGVLWVGLPLASGQAAVSYTTPGSTVSQNFDSLGSSGASWTNDSTLPGWFFLNASGATPNVYSAVDGSNASQNLILSLGTTGSTDRALGFQNNAVTGVGRYGIALGNTTGFTLQSFFVQYTGETWRFIGPEPAETIAFEYQIFNSGSGSLTAASGWTSVSGLNFTSPTTPAPTTVTSLDGNDTANRTTLSQTIAGITWASGQELWLRWNDSAVWNGTNNNSLGLHKNGIDDFTFVATVPEPASGLFLAVGGLALLGYRKRTRASGVV